MNENKKMIELKKVDSDYYDDCYETMNPRTGITVGCILDDNCVRFCVYKMGRWGWKETYRHEFSNDEKEKCFKLATRYLNK